MFVNFEGYLINWSGLDLKQQLHVRKFWRLLDKWKWLVYKVERELCHVGWCGVRQGEMGYLLPQQDSISLTMYIVIYRVVKVWTLHFFFLVLLLLLLLFMLFPCQWCFFFRGGGYALFLLLFFFFWFFVVPYALPLLRLMLVVIHVWKYLLLEQHFNNLSIFFSPF